MPNDLVRMIEAKIAEVRAPVRQALFRRDRGAFISANPLRALA